MSVVTVCMEHFDGKTDMEGLWDPPDTLRTPQTPPRQSPKMFWTLRPLCRRDWVSWELCSVVLWMHHLQSIHCITMLHNSYFLWKVFSQELEVMTPPHISGTHWHSPIKCRKVFWNILSWCEFLAGGSQVRQAVCGGDGSREYGSQPHRFGLDASPSNHQKIDLAPHGKLIPFLHCGRRFPNNGDPPVGLADSQDVHLFKGRGRGGGPSGVALTVFPNNLRHSEKVFGQLQYQTTINLRRHLQI